MSALTGTSSYVITSHVEIYRTCSVDLRWQRSIHSCQRCPRAVPVTNAMAIPPLTQSQVERTHSRFCPSGVHMSSCIPATDRFLASNNFTGSAKLTVGTAGEAITSNEPIGVTLFPPNLPVPHHPANLSRLSYPPASSATSTENQHTKSKTTIHQVITGEPAKSNGSGRPLVCIDGSTGPSELVNANVETDSSLRQTGPPKVERIVSSVVTIVREPPKKETILTYKLDEIKADEPVGKTNGLIHSPELVAEPDATSPTSPAFNEKMEPGDGRNSDASLPKEVKKDEPSPTSTKSKMPSDTLTINNEPMSNRSTYKVTSTETGTDAAASTGTSTSVGRHVSKPISTNGSIGVTPLYNTAATNHRSQSTTCTSPAQESKHTADGLGDVSSTPTRPSTIPIDSTLPPTDVSFPPKKKQPRIPSPLSKQPVPAFYFPHGTTRMTKEEVRFEMTRAKREMVRVLESLPDVKKISMDTLIPYAHFAKVAKALNCPMYWNYVIYSASGGTVEHASVPLSAVLDVWEKMLITCPDETARFVHMLTNGKSTHLVATDFRPLIQDILETHPGLAFLRSAKDFHSRYVGTVVARIFFNVNASWSGQISLAELRKSNFISVLASLEDQEDINLVTQYFSYEHFYVIYCKFWELDEDHDLIINRADLTRHNNYAISERMVDRIFSGTVTRAASLKEGVMSYADFVWFLLAEEDKRHPRSVEYWFRCMDLDGDGVLSIYELEYFYSEQVARLEEMGIDPIAFEDCLCQCLDMVKPKYEHKILLSDLKRCRLSHIFFDTFFNLPKYLQHEQRDPFSNLRDIEEGLSELSDWDRYAAETYEMLVAIEGDNQADALEDEDEEESDEDHVINAANHQLDDQHPSTNAMQQKEPISIVKQEVDANCESTETATSDLERKDKRKRTPMVNGAVTN